MKKPDYLIIVSSETSEGKEVTKADIITQHTQSRSHGGLGFNRPAIDYLVLSDGTLETILQEEYLDETDLWGISDGVDGLTGLAKYLAYAGGMSKSIQAGSKKEEEAAKAKDTRTEAQQDTMEAVVHFYVRRFPDIQIMGMNQVPAKEGSKDPAFDVSAWLEAIGIPTENIFQP